MIEQEHIDFCLFGIAVVIAFLVVFLGGKTCCTFDCTPNVDTAIENKIKDRQKATLQATRVIHACRKESLFFYKQIGQCPSTNYASSMNGFKMG